LYNSFNVLEGETTVRYDLTLGVIGNLGKLAKGIIEPKVAPYFARYIGSDIRNGGMTNEEVAAEADALLGAFLPFRNADKILLPLIPHMKKGTVVVNMSSAAMPRSADMRKVAEACRKQGVDFMHIHPMAPGILWGVPVIICTPFPLLNAIWADVWYDIFVAEKSIIEEYDSLEQHDFLTYETQMRPMGLSVLNTLVPSGKDLGEVMRYAGASTRLIGLGMWRHYAQPEVVGEVITQHPEGPRFARELVRSARELARIINEQDQEAVVRAIRGYVSRISLEDQQVITFQSDWLNQQISDLNGNVVALEVPAERNKLGLGSGVLATFDECGEDKTTTSMQTKGDGIAIFLIGVKDPNSRTAKRAVRLLKERYGARPRRIGFTLH
jgi:prephenate dehydrogenase